MTPVAVCYYSPTYSPFYPYPEQEPASINSIERPTILLPNQLSSLLPSHTYSCLVAFFYSHGNINSITLSFFLSYKRRPFSSCFFFSFHSLLVLYHHHQRLFFSAFNFSELKLQKQKQKHHRPPQLRLTFSFSSHYHPIPLSSRRPFLETLFRTLTFIFFKLPLPLLHSTPQPLPRK